MGGQGAKAKGIGWSETIAPTIKSVMSGSNTIPDVVYSLHDKATRHKGGGETRKNDGAANGLGIQADGKMFTLDTSCRHGIVYRCLKDGVYTVDETCQTLRARITRDRADIITCTLDARMGGDGDGKGAVYPTITGALRANSYPGSYTEQDAFNDMLPVIKVDKPPRKYIVRRLTPLECCRLQGFPDWWEDGAEGSDSARYKMWGNGIALPCAVDVLRRVAKAGASDA